MRRRLFAALAILAASDPLGAASLGFRDPAPGGGGRTIEEYAAVAFPGLAREVKGELRVAPSIAPIRRLTPDMDAPEPAARHAMTGASALALKVDGRPALAILFWMDGSDLAPLGLFSLDGPPRLLDFVHVRSDRIVSLGEAALALSGTDDSVIVRNSHFNSSQSYEQATVVLARGGRWSAVASVFTFGDRLCRAGMTQTSAFRALPGRPMATIVADVAIETQAYAPDCQTKRRRPTRKTVSGRWTWDAARGANVARTGALDALAKANEKRF